MATFLFCLPRFHTNAAPWMRILQSAGNQAAVDVVEKGATENHGLVSPVLHQPGWFSRRVGGLLKDDGPNGRYVTPGLVAYWRHMAAIDPDVVVVRGVTRWFCRVAALCAVLQRRTLVIYDQEDVSPRPWSGTWVRRAVFRLAGVPHVTARIDAAASAGGMGSAISLPFGCPVPQAQAGSFATRTLRRPPRLLMVAKYRSRKGHGVLLEALAGLRELPFSLTFCGEEVGESDAAFCRDLRSRAEALGLGERLRFNNNVAPSDMAQLYAEHDLFVLPSQVEPAAVSPIEAAWFGCAVLLSRDSGTRGYFPAGPDFDFAAEDPTDIRRAVGDLLAEPGRLQSARDAVRARLEAVAGEEAIMAVFNRLKAPR